MMKKVAIEQTQSVYQDTLQCHALAFETTPLQAVMVRYELNLLRDKIWHH
jgi:hypothetical protein